MIRLIYKILLLTFLTSCVSETEENNAVEVAADSPAFYRNALAANFGALFAAVQVEDGKIFLDTNVDRRGGGLTSLKVDLPKNKSSNVTIYWLEDYIDSDSNKRHLLYLAKQEKLVAVGTETESHIINTDYIEEGQLREYDLGVSNDIPYISVCDQRLLLSGVGGGNPCSADYDGDGVSNLQERKDGTDPLRKVCFQEITSEGRVVTRCEPDPL